MYKHIQRFYYYYPWVVRRHRAGHPYPPWQRRRRRRRPTQRHPMMRNLSRSGDWRPTVHHRPAPPTHTSTCRLRREPSRNGNVYHAGSSISKAIRHRAPKIRSVPHQHPHALRKSSLKRCCVRSWIRSRYVSSKWYHFFCHLWCYPTSTGSKMDCDRGRKAGCLNYTLRCIHACIKKVTMLFGVQRLDCFFLPRVVQPALALPRLGQQDPHTNLELFFFW